MPELTEMYTLGIDIGSSASKAVIMKNGKYLVDYAAIQMGTGSSGPEAVLELLYKSSGLSLAEMAYSVVTGYGRMNFTQADKQIGEITCHAKGVRFFVPTAGTVIDIGGQDVKAMVLDSQGMVKKFFMNDKCAAGTGRLLEMMAKVLDVGLEKFALYDEQAERIAPISSTCTVFAESEVISQLSKGERKENIIAGVHQSVASKAMALACRGGVIADVVFTGGVAQNAGVWRALEREMNTQIIIPNLPQFTGAVGAALLAYENVCQERRQPC